MKNTSLNNNEKLRLKAYRKYRLLSCHRYFVFAGNKKYEESLVLSIENNGGSICFTFTDLATEEIMTFDNPETGEYIIPLTKGNKMKLVITASKAIGSYKIVKKSRLI